MMCYVRLYDSHDNVGWNNLQDLHNYELFGEYLRHAREDVFISFYYTIEDT